MPKSVAFTWGRCPQTPGIYRFRARMDESRAACAAPPFRPLVGAPGRGRDEHRCPPPAQIRTSGITAYGSSLGCGRRNAHQDKDEECVDEESIVRRWAADGPNRACTVDYGGVERAASD